MTFLDILYLSLRNLREAKLRATLTTMGVIVGVAVIVTMISFGLGLQRNTVSRFKELDLFNEITVFGRSLSAIASSGFNKNAGNANAKPQAERVGNRSLRPDKTPQRALNDAAITEIAQIPGVAYVEPTINFNVYVRSNNHALMQSIGGAVVPNPSSRFKEYAAGGMIGAPLSDEAVVDEDFARDFGYEKPEDAVGKNLELLAPNKDDEGEAPSFFGLPLEDVETEDAARSSRLAARTFRIVGVLKTPENGPRFRGMMPASDIYIPLQAARDWTLKYRDNLSEVALELARESGAIGENETGGYGSAVLRVTDPVLLTDVRRRLTELGFGSFSIVDQLEQLRTVFLIINATLGLLGGISLLVASFGIANTMIMSILERTREIGIMKAIGAEDREIKLIFFVEAAVIGLVGGVVGSLMAWAIDGVANRLAYRFILKPQGASYIDFFALPAYLWLGAILFAVVISILAALYPASRAARIDPVKALRHD
ncbi:MAG TPA: FtsX-like permease family protein [Pyrinomonadaceae bacterium]|jgi:ABC-type antimicrobial peptide transport system permease subunit|nr:FtsX-like permease family protein [Pyrinomonadaceae bacterium]